MKPNLIVWKESFRKQARLGILAFSAMLMCDVSMADDNHPSCGQQSLHKIMSLIGQEVSLERCGEVLNETGDVGASLANIVDASSALGANAWPVRLRAEELSYFNCPAILHVNLPQTPNHYMVFVGYKDHLFSVYDGTSKIAYRVTMNQLSQIWEGHCIVYLSGGLTGKARLLLLRIGDEISVLFGILLASIIVHFLSAAMPRCTKTRVAKSCRYSVATLAMVVLLFALSKQLSDYPDPGKEGRVGASVIDFGEIDYGESVQAAVWFVNHSESSLNFDGSKVKQTCRCFKIVVPEGEVPPKGAEDIQIKLRPMKEGLFDYAALIPAFTPEGKRHENKIHLKGSCVRRDIRVYPPSLYFDENDTNPRVFKVYQNWNKFEIVDVKADFPLEYNCKQTAEGYVFEVSRPATTLPRQKATLILIIHSSLSEDGKIEIEVPIHVQGGGKESVHTRDIIFTMKKATATCTSAYGSSLLL